jgi:hypothetical protein
MRFSAADARLHQPPERGACGEPRVMAINRSQAINKILWEDWDPICVNAIGVPDEYQSYANYLAGLCERGTTAAVIFELLRYFRTELMMLPADDEADIRVAEKVLHS